MFAKLVVLSLALALVVALAARGSHSAGPQQTYVVRPTDTLWSIATAHYAGDPRDAIWRIEHRNGLAGALVRPGQRLVLPP